MQDDEQAQQPQTPGHAAAAAALRQSVEINRREVQLASETIAVLRSEIKLAVAGAIEQALSEGNAERFWSIGLALLQKQAAQKTGVLVGGALMALVKKGAVFLLLGGLVYAVGGWTALAQLLKLLAEAK